jgi:hypothetical protein
MPVSPTAISAGEPGRPFGGLEEKREAAGLIAGADARRAPSARRLLHEGGDFDLRRAGQCRQREADRPHGAFKERRGVWIETGKRYAETVGPLIASLRNMRNERIEGYSDEDPETTADFLTRFTNNVKERTKRTEADSTGPRVRIFDPRRRSSLFAASSLS